VNIRLRLTLYWAIITAAILFAAGLLLLFFFWRSSWITLDLALGEEVNTAAAALSHSAASDALVILQHLVEEHDELGPGRRVRLIVAGRIVFDGGDPEMRPPRVPANGRSGVLVDHGDHRYRFAEARFVSNGQEAWLQDGVEDGSVDRTVVRLRSTLLVLLPVVLILCVAGGYWLSVNALSPIETVTRALATIGPHDLGQRLPTPEVRDEACCLVEEINELLDRLERASAAQRRFTSEAAHELRTPLTVVRAGLEVALRRPRTVAASRLAMTDALAGIVRLCAIAEDLLALARIAPEHDYRGQEQAELGEIVKAVSNDLRTLAEAKRQTLGIATPDRITVCGKANDMRRLVVNLLDNAIKFTPIRGRVEVAVGQEERSALLWVRDSGPGLEPEELSRMFDPFYRSPRKNGVGSGLGLALCREIVQISGGEIRAANRAGGGCEIEVRLPLVAAAGDAGLS
jgi:signal transduction histidine kinase